MQRYSGPGNPIGTQLLRIGDMVATKVPFLKQNELMNSVHHLEDPALLPEVLAFYAATEQTCWVPVAPYAPASVTDALIRARISRRALPATLVAEPETGRAERRRAPAVREIEPRGTRRVFLDTMNVGFDSPAATLESLRRNQSFWCDVPNWHLYLARVDGVPAGAAVLSIHGDIGYLAAGSVLPQFRGRGLHAALIAARLDRCRDATLQTGDRRRGVGIAEPAQSAARRVRDRARQEHLDEQSSHAQGSNGRKNGSEPLFRGERHCP